MKKTVTQNKFYKTLTSRTSQEVIRKIKNITIGIAGCGGLGSNAAIALVRTGAMHLVIADFDRVELSNLNRQQYSLDDIGSFKVDALEKILISINPFAEIKKYNLKLNRKNIYSIFNNCKIIIEAFDRVTSKSMLIKSFSHPDFAGKYLIMGSGLSGFSPANRIRTKRIARNIFVCGDFYTEAGKSKSLMAPRVMITSGHQVNKALEIIAGLEI